MDASAICRRDHAEAPGRRHDVELVAAFEFIRRPVRKCSAVNLLHGNADLAIVRTRADRIGAPDFLAIEHGAEREVLAGRESVVAREFAGDRKGHRYGIGRLAAEVVDGQAMKARCGCGHDQ
jgi:hypothetical protein